MASHAAYGGKGPMAGPSHYASVNSPTQAQPTPSGSGGGSDVDMSESSGSSEGDSSGEDYDDAGAAGNASVSSHEQPKPKPRAKPSRKLDLPSNVDADLYGLRRSVSTTGLARGLDGREWRADLRCRRNARWTVCFV